MIPKSGYTSPRAASRDFHRSHPEARDDGVRARRAHTGNTLSHDGHACSLRRRQLIATDCDSASPNLPAGLTLNTASGVISGRPTVAAAMATYTVSAMASGTPVSGVGHPERRPDVRYAVRIHPCAAARHAAIHVALQLQCQWRRYRPPGHRTLRFRNRTRPGSPVELGLYAAGERAHGRRADLFRDAPIDERAWRPHLALVPRWHTGRHLAIGLTYIDLEHRDRCRHQPAEQWRCRGCAWRGRRFAHRFRFRHEPGRAVLLKRRVKNFH